MLGLSQKDMTLGVLLTPMDGFYLTKMEYFVQNSGI